MRYILIYLIGAITFPLVQMCIDVYHLLKVRKKWYQNMDTLLYHPSRFSKEDAAEILQSILAEAIRYQRSTNRFFQWLLWNKYVNSLLDRAAYCLHLFGYSVSDSCDITEQWAAERRRLK